ncbi:MAG: hypothetical protein KBT34_05485 [Prevotella sp.]|nr:hypothetical protein [Candidatus Prevotella equi]
MKKEKILAIAKKMVEKRCNEAYERMQSMPLCKQLYDDMRKAGYGQQMKIFKDLVFLSTIQHPEWTDEQILLNIHGRFMKTA